MKILIADPSEVYCETLSEHLKEHYSVLTCTDGAEVFPLLHTHQPDLLVLGLDMPNVDGLSILSLIRDSGISVKVLCTAFIYTEYDLSVLHAFAISHLIRKPSVMCVLVSRIYEMLRHDHSEKTSHDAEAVMQLLGLRMNLTGYDCLCTAIALLREDPHKQITKVIYPEVAKICGGTPERVERAMRSVIRDAWLRRDERIWMAYFPKNRADRIKAPSNGDFITRIAFCGKDNKACG